MNKSNNKTNQRNALLGIGIISVLTLFMMSTSLNGAMALDNGGYTFLDCVYDNDTNKETCCDGPDDNIKCLECDVDLNTGQKSNCKEVPNKSETSENPRIPDSVFDSGISEKKDSVKQFQQLGEFSQSLSEFK
ncbi:MAG TPA: hypothetical protein VD815_09270 [Candidatus Saccharimonadales bacterium]|nr:hypothetical protein [Candidatus Saccharimonadales bacterium]